MRNFWLVSDFAYLVNLSTYVQKRAISLTENPEFHRKTKHIEVHWHWIREKVERKVIVMSYISTKEMRADGLTKALSSKMFKDFRRMIGMS